MESSVELPSIPGYSIERLIHEGGMGQVYQGVQIATERPVAIKLPIDGLGNEKFDREILFASRVQHEYVVPIYHGNHGLNGVPLFIAMRLILNEDGQPADGCKFLDWLRSNVGSIKIGSSHHYKWLASIVRNIADALAAVHKEQIIHGDVKLQNLLVDANNALHLTDFGLADNFAYSHYGSEGTSFFVSPEQKQGNPTHQSDIYSFGVTAAVLFGAVDFATLASALASIPTSTSGESRSSLEWQLESLSQKLDDNGSLWTLPADFKLSTLCPNAPLYLRWIVDKATCQNPSERFGTSAEVSNHLDRFIAGDPCVVDPLRTLKAIWRWAMRRLPWLALGIALIAASTAIGLNILQNQLRNSERVSANERLVAQDDKRRQQIIEQAEELLRDGLSEKARPLFQAAMNSSSNTPLHWRVMYLRSLIGERSTKDIVTELLTLREKHARSETGYTELLFLLFDLVACDGDLREVFDWQSELESLDQAELTVADRNYLAALLAPNTGECVQHLKLALLNSQFHDRASELLVSLYVSLGQLTLAIDACDTQLSAKPGNARCLLMKTAAEIIGNRSEGAELRISELSPNVAESFVNSMRDLLPRRATTAGDSESGYSVGDAVSMQTQIASINSASKFVSVIPTALEDRPVPLHPFEMRAADWTHLATALKECAENRFSSESLRKVELLAAVESDGFASLLMSMTLSFEIASLMKSGEYKALAGQRFEKFLEYQELAISKESLLSRPSIRFFNRFIQISAQAAMAYEIEPPDQNSRSGYRFAGKSVIEECRNVPARVREELLALLFATLDESIASQPSTVKRGQLCRDALTIADDWIENFPQDMSAWLFHGKLLVHLGQPSEALFDIEKALQINPDHEEAKQLFQQLQAGN